jgi:predicted tellurium resistance membrane protein TerC
MPRRPFPVFVLSVGFALVLFTAIRPLFAQPAPAPAAPPAGDPPHFQKVRVEPAAGGSAVEGRLKLPAISLTTDIGTAAIGLSHIKRVTFQKDPEGKSQDTVQLTDNSIVRGHVTDEVFVVEIPGGEARLKKAEVREIKVVSEEKLSLTAILLGLLTLTAMEIVLGVDNIIFLAIIASRLPKEQQPRARKIGLAAALGTRLLLLGSLWLLLGLTAPLFTLPDLGFLHDMEAREVSWRDLILLGGGLFLIGKSTFEMHSKIEEAKSESEGQPARPPAKPVSFGWTIVTIAVIDIVFSLDSVITAVGMVEHIWVMIVAMVLSMLVMLYFAGPIAEFVDRHPTIKVLALSFLILIGVMLVAEGLGQHIDKGYIYASMAFALVVELVNMRLRGPKKERAGEKKEPPKKAEPPRPAGS